ncbi:MAG: methionine adenosyltransferase [Gemmatimonadota bacterium]
MSRQLFTSESVTEGHPDKIADQISDAVLDAVLERDPDGRVACEVLLTTGLALVAGEITAAADVDVPAVVRSVLRSIGYTDARFGIDAESCGVLNAIGRQSPDIARGVDPGGAGDQGMMFGYATDETPALMPAPILLAHTLTRRLARVRRDGEVPWLRPDGKAQITLAYDDDAVARVDTVVISAQHSPEADLDALRDTILERVIAPSLPAEWFDVDACTIHVNPTGRFVIGGPHGDTGLTGRKIIVDTYGGVARHGGGAFSGKDPSKVDRSGAYAARWAAKNVVAAGLARRCEVRLAYAIGVAEPVEVHVDTFGTGEPPDDAIARAVGRVFDFRPRAIIEALDLASPIYRPTAVYGHFGREPYTARAGERDRTYFPWERTNRADDLRTAIQGH